MIGRWGGRLPLNNDECNELCKRCPSLPSNSEAFDIWSWLAVMERSILLESEGGKITEQIAEIIG